MGSIERKWRPVSRIVTGVLAVLLSATAPIFGQERFGEINGVVTDPSGAAVPRATVMLTNKDINRSITVTSGSEGAYIATDIEPGHYRVRVTAPGFAASEVPNVNLLVGKTLRVDIRLNVGATSETVQVLEVSPL